MSKARTKRRNLVAEYYEKEITIGGLPTTRGQFIKEMLEAGHPMRCIDMYLFSMDQRADREMAREKARWEGSIKEEARL